VRTIIFKRGWCSCALVEWLIIVVDFKSLSTKLKDFIGKSIPNIAHDIEKRSTVFAMREWTRYVTTKGCALTFKRRVRTLLNTEALLCDVALTLDFGNADDITHLRLIFDPPQPLASDFDVNATQLGILGVLLANLITRVE
jgi:hypothetical protein